MENKEFLDDRELVAFGHISEEKEILFEEKIKEIDVKYNTYTKVRMRPIFGRMRVEIYVSKDTPEEIKREIKQITYLISQQVN